MQSRRLGIAGSLRVSLRIISDEQLGGGVQSRRLGIAGSLTASLRIISSPFAGVESA